MDIAVRCARQITRETSSRRWPPDQIAERSRTSTESFALIAMARGEERRAATLLGAAASLREVAGAPTMPWERDTYDAALARLRSSIRRRLGPGPNVSSHRTC